MSAINFGDENIFSVDGPNVFPIYFHVLGKPVVFLFRRHSSVRSFMV